jgi:formylglycine-generating enzyme required for sulfatase activity
VDLTNRARALARAATWLAGLWLVAAPAAAAELLDAVRRQVVAIEAEWRDGSSRHGFGFVVGEDDDRPIIATADHLLRGRGPDATATRVSLRWFDAPLTRVEARRLPTRANRLDLGVLVAERPAGFAFEPRLLDPAAADLAPGAPLWFIGRSDDWYVPQLPGAVNHVSRLDDEIVADGLAVRPGTSGAPLLSQGGIVGMIVRDVDSEEVRATTITAIAHAFAEWRLPWGLQPAGAPAAAEDCPFCPEIVALDGGTFRLGSPPDEPGRHADEGPPTRVRVTPFGLGRHEVTVAQYARFAEATGVPGRGCSWYGPDGWELDPTRDWRSPGIAQGPDDPVVCVGFDEARAYVDWLRAETGVPYRLPSEAEWEFAARAGSVTPYAVGTVLEPSDANIAGAVGTTSPVGSYPANAWGLADVHGNVWEWVADCWAPSHAGRPRDAAARLEGAELDCTRRVIRGGSWASAAGRARAAHRGANGTDARNIYIGFRVARDLP